MEKISVKKPYTVLVAVVMVIVLGVVSITGMTTDLLPSLSLPYLMVITTYPGASPERVESDVVRPLESALGTINGVENIASTSAENYGMIQLEFADGTDMDSTIVKVSGALQQAQSSLPEGCGAPSIVELSMDMMATMYISVSRDDYDVYQLSSFVKDTVQPFLERQNGVASVTGIGIVEQSVSIALDSEKIDGINEKILTYLDETLAQAKEKLDTAEQEVLDGKAALEKAQASFGSTLSGTLFDQVGGKVNETVNKLKPIVSSLLEDVRALRSLVTDSDLAGKLDATAQELEKIQALLGSQDIDYQDLLQVLGSLQVISDNLLDVLKALPPLEPVEPPSVELQSIRLAIEKIEKRLAELKKLVDSVPDIMDSLQNAYAGMTQAQLDAAVQFASASIQLSNAQTQLATAKEEFASAKESAYAKANLDQLLSLKTLSGLIYAQNFAMPAGYIDDKDDNSWLLKVGNGFTSAEELAGAILVSMDGIGQVRISDVATVTVIDNAGDSFTRLNGDQSVILGIYKSSVAGTNDTAKTCLAAIKDFEAKYEGTHIVTLMNQGGYIDIIIKTVVSSMVTGAILAILILALFLRDVKPTLVVGISIPLSVVFTLVLMYFSEISLNTMTLAGLSLGIGMLVDNSIVVMENIYRLRGLGVSAPRAAVQGTKQVSGAIISSTLTTVCVFFPLVFTEGMVRELLLPMGLTIGFCLGASLVVALTVVPAAASTLLRNSKSKSSKFFDKLQNGYAKFLNWCLDHKAVPITVSVVLLCATIWAVLNMGIVLLPDMTANQIEVSVQTPEGLTREESYEMAADVMDLLLEVDGVDNVGVMDSGSTMGLLGGGFGTGSSTYGKYVYYVALPDNTPTSTIQRITKDISALSDKSECTIEASGGGLNDMSAMLGSGLSLNIYGEDLDTLKVISGELQEIVEQVDGYTEIQTSFQDEDPTIHLSIDRDKAMANGLTVAQIYMSISERMTTSQTAATITLNGMTMDVTVENHRDPLTLENLLNMEFEVSKPTLTGESVTETHTLSEFATIEETASIGTIHRDNQSRYVTVSASVAEGFNATLLSRQLSKLLDDYRDSGSMPDGYSFRLSGESSTVNDMVSQLLLLIALGAILIYLIMVAQFQSLLSPFIVLFTVPLAFTGGMIGLLIYGQQLSMLSMMGFAVLMGTVVNNGIVFVDYVNQLRIGGLDRRTALIATGKTRMRPILMTALTTILAMFQLIFSDDMAGEMGGGMSVVIVGGLAYATVMTLIIVPVVYDILFKREPKTVDIGSENLDDVPDDAAQFLQESETVK